VIGELSLTHLRAANSKRRAALPCALVLTYSRAACLCPAPPAFSHPAPPRTRRLTAPGTHHRHHGRPVQAQDDEEEEPQGARSQRPAAEARALCGRRTGARRRGQRRQAGHARDWRRVPARSQGRGPDRAAGTGFRKRRHSQQGAACRDKGGHGEKGEPDVWGGRAWDGTDKPRSSTWKPRTRSGSA
jgi:hypothetical protein